MPVIKLYLSENASILSVQNPRFNLNFLFLMVLVVMVIVIHYVHSCFCAQFTDFLHQCSYISCALDLDMQVLFK